VGVNTGDVRKCSYKVKSISGGSIMGKF